jgi:hypothetical protein
MGDYNVYYVFKLDRFQEGVARRPGADPTPGLGTGDCLSSDDPITFLESATHEVRP